MCAHALACACVQAHRPLPPGWLEQASKSKSGRRYFYNTNTGKSTWRRPLLDDAEQGDFQEEEEMPLKMHLPTPPMPPPHLRASLIEQAFASVIGDIDPAV